MAVPTCVIQLNLVNISWNLWRCSLGLLRWDGCDFVARENDGLDLGKK